MTSVEITRRRRMCSTLFRFILERKKIRGFIVQLLIFVQKSTTSLRSVFARILIRPFARRLFEILISGCFMRRQL